MAYIEGTIDNDFLESLLGDDVIDGLAGNDTVSYADALGGVTVSLALLGLDQNTGGAGVDRLISIERLGGSAYADTLTGNAGTNFLYGGDGFDQLFGGAGNDRLYGELGNDKLDGGTGADFMRGGEGDDIYYVDNISDVIEEWWQEGEGGSHDLVRTIVSYTLPANVEWLQLYITLVDGVVTHLPLSGTGNARRNVMDGNAAANTLYGLGGNDILRGHQGDDHLFGGDDDDQLYGSEGNDLLDGGLGNDLIDGGVNDDIYNTSAIDTVDYSWVPNGIRVDLGQTGPQDMGAAGIDRLRLIEGVIGTAFDDDLIGNADNNVFHSGDGDDSLNGGEGDDYFDAGSGVNRLSGGSGDLDIVSYAGATRRISINLFEQAANPVNHGRGLDQLSGMEGVIGSDFDDNLLGGTGRIFIDGGGGNDTIVNARSAIGELHGGAGNDLVVGGMFDDILYGGEGNDLMRANTGKNRMYGGTGDDLYELGSYADVIVEAPDEGFDTVQFGASFRLPANVEKGILLLNGDLWGNDLDNVLVIRPLGGVTDVWGGAGADVFSYYDIAAIGRMRIRDFESGTDKIDLSNIFDDGFAFRGDAGRSGDGDQIWTTQFGNATILHAVFDAREQFTVWLYDLATPISTSDFIL